MTIPPHNSPRVHSDGTSLERLLEIHADARDAITQATVWLRRAAPDQRDYPLAEDQPRYAAARAQHIADVAALERIARG